MTGPWHGGGGGGGGGDGALGGGGGGGDANHRLAALCDRSTASVAFCHSTSCADSGTEPTNLLARFQLALSAAEW